MNKTYLVQRLEKPRHYLNPCSFYAWLDKEGRSKKVSQIVKHIWRFDCMRASEFKLGIIPRALEHIAKYSQEGRAVTGQLQLGKKVLYLCENNMKDGVEDTIGKIAKGRQSLLEPALLKESIEGKGYVRTYRGWLELDNGYMFFIDEGMFHNSIRLFGIRN